MPAEVLTSLLISHWEAAHGSISAPSFFMAGKVFLQDQLLFQVTGRDLPLLMQSGLVEGWVM